MPRHVLLVGHCGPDAFMLKNAVMRSLEGAEVVMVNDEASLETRLGRGAVLLVNRELDGDFGAGSGVELIRTLAGREGAPPMMLVSNFPDAQEAAVAAGARPGFGKSDLYEDRTAEMLRDAVES